MASPAEVTDHGEWLSFEMPHGGSTVPVRISRAAMEEHFDAGQGPDSLARAYELDGEMIRARAADQIVSGVAYTADQPLVLGSEHF